ncbi:hypothetical protein EAG_04019 [Camponotus floridanus]|uniref:Uncharacterized protein n=1 Tax=Camponotus floridanus TaxID=104421 RepID=E2B145_CAMFO|nr:hypothetical protein EAG_04019 [Camponotus floridanus]
MMERSMEGSMSGLKMKARSACSVSKEERRRRMDTERENGEIVKVRELKKVVEELVKKRKKTTMEQRLLMLQFMEEHWDFVQNRISGLDAKKETALLWEDLTNRLNSTSNGVTKSTDKWIKATCGASATLRIGADSNHSFGLQGRIYACHLPVASSRFSRLFLVSAWFEDFSGSRSPLLYRYPVALNSAELAPVRGSDVRF